jgi:cyanophycin synthetase
MTEGSMVRFGWGSKQRRIQAAEMDITSAICRSHCAGQGSDQETAGRGRCARAWRARRDLTPKTRGGRAVKSACRWWSSPKMATRAKGVTVNIKPKNTCCKAYATAREFRDDILVERYMPGNDFRLLSGW